MGSRTIRRVFVAAFGAFCGCGFDAVGLLPASGVVGGDAESTVEGGPSVDGGADGGDPTDASEIDLSCGAMFATDPANCGSCGHDCKGGTCNSGRCMPVELVTLPGKIVRAVAADATNIYWANSTDSTIVRAALDGKNPSNLVANVNVSQLAVNASHVFYTTGDLRRHSLTSNDDIRVFQGAGSCVSLTPDGSRVLTANFSSNELFSVKLDGSDEQTLLSGNGVFHPWGVAMTPTHLYWSNAGHGDPDGSIVRRLLPSGPNEVLRAHSLNPNCLTFDESGNLYWPYADEGTIHRSKADGTDDVTLATGADTATQVAVNAAFIYWNSGDKVMRLAR